MTFGLRNAAQTFQRHLSEVLKGIDFAFAYIDDILIASTTAEQHEEHLRIVFDRLRKYHLTVNFDKCQFGKSELVFLGHKVSSSGLTPPESKVDAIRNFERPTVAKNLKKFLGMLNFYRPFLPHAMKNQSLLLKLIPGNKKNDNSILKWTPESIAAFDDCKNDIANAALLNYMAPNAVLTLTTDASDDAVGAVLHQVIEGQIQPLGFYSRKLTPSQQNYSAYDRELTAIYQAIQHFKYALEGREFIVFTDHKPITFAFRQKSDKASPRRVRQLDFISQYTTDIRHLPGADNNVADLLSRINAIENQEIDFDEMAEHQNSDAELQTFLNNNNANVSLKLSKFTIPNSSKELYCDVSKGRVRPYVPEKCRETVMKKLHSLSHPGMKATKRLVANHYVWPSMYRDVALYVRSCIPCQRSKIHRHTRSPLRECTATDARFEYINQTLSVLYRP